MSWRANATMRSRELGRSRSAARNSVIFPADIGEASISSAHSRSARARSRSLPPPGRSTCAASRLSAICCMRLRSCTSLRRISIWSCCFDEGMAIQRVVGRLHCVHADHAAHADVEHGGQRQRDGQPDPAGNLRLGRMGGHWRAHGVVILSASRSSRISVAGLAVVDSTLSTAQRLMASCSSSPLGASAIRMRRGLGVKVPHLLQQRQPVERRRVVADNDGGDLTPRHLAQCGVRPQHAGRPGAPRW